VPSGGTRIVSLGGAPLIRFTGEQRVRHVFVPLGSPRLTENPATSVLKLWVWTQGDDLRGEDDNATGIFEFRDGSRHEFPMNAGGKWDKLSRYSVMVRLPTGKKYTDLRAFGIRTNFRGGGGGDNWDIGKIALEAFEDPLTSWTTEFAAALATMGGGRVAIGTDFNGFAPQIPMSATTLAYPFSYPAELGRPITLQRASSGRRSWDFTTDGIAHVGMLPDFMAAAAQRAGGRNIAPLFRSADDFVTMWEKVEAAARVVP
jgi:hypothetical protein